MFDEDGEVSILVHNAGCGGGSGIGGGALNIPQGLTNSQFDEVSRVVRIMAGEIGLGDDIFVQGSRAAGTAKPTSDLDIAIRLSPEKFDNFLRNQSKLNRVNPGSAKEKTLLRAIETGKIQAGESTLITGQKTARTVSWNRG